MLTASLGFVLLEVTLHGLYNKPLNELVPSTHNL